MKEVNTMKNNYKVDFAKGKIILTRDFTNKANIVNSEEYKILRQLKKDFPNLTISQKTAKTNTTKTTYNGLTLDRMEQFIIRFDNSSLQLFNEKKEYYKKTNSSFAPIKSWFIANYKNYKEIEIGKSIVSITVTATVTETPNTERQEDEKQVLPLVS